MNNRKKIDELLARFYEGVTSLEEEVYLYRLLLDQPKDVRFSAEELAFMAMMETFDDVSVASWSKEDREFAEWLDGKTIKKQGKAISFLRHLPNWRKYAAAIIGVLILGALTFLFDVDEQKPLALKDGRAISQEEAAKEIEKSLQLFAHCFMQTEAVKEKTEETFSVLNRALNKVIIDNKQ